MQEFDKEEQETLHFILEDLCDQLDDTSDEGDREMLNREIAFLRSLEHQPKYRWSAEDNKIRAQITKYFECQIESEPTRKDVLLKWIAWVANLRPQKQWKPSEEQINALAKNVEYVNVGCTQPILKALLEDLKKLREE